MPGQAGDLRPGGRTSEACWQAYGEVTGYELSHLPILGRLHQLTVDAYQAQHARGASPMVVAFALVGLHLALDGGWRGDQVRAAHQLLATDRSGWPDLGPVPAPTSWQLTVGNLAQAGSPERHADLVQRWAKEVWAAWMPAHAAVHALLETRLPLPARGRILRDP